MTFEKQPHSPLSQSTNTKDTQMNTESIHTAAALSPTNSSLFGMPAAPTVPHAYPQPSTPILINQPVGSKDKRPQSAKMLKEKEIDDAVRDACGSEQREIDAELRKLSRPRALELPTPLRLRWFFLKQVKHDNLNQVYHQLRELLEPTNEMNILSLVGMSGIGKTTLAQQLVPQLAQLYHDAPAHEVPVVYVKVPANGERSVSWKVLYHRINDVLHETLQDKKITLDRSDKAAFRYSKRSDNSVWGLRERLEPVLLHRNVRVLVLDEFVHLMRFDNYNSIMDSIKSLSDVGNVKLLLIGTFDIVKLVGSYGQVVRRGEIVHYRRYVVGERPVSDEKATPDQVAFKKALASLESVWPANEVPNLQAVWYDWMRQSLGSVGLLKLSLTRLAALQMHSKDGKLTISMLKKTFKAPKALRALEEETIKGEALISGLSYGESEYTEDQLKAMLKGLEKKD